MSKVNFQAIKNVLVKPLEWIGFAVFTLVQGLKVVFMTIRLSWSTRHGKIRWSIAGIVLLTLVTGTYNYAKPYNDAVTALNSQLAALETRSMPEAFAFVKDVAKVRLPVVTETPFHLGLDLVGGTQLLYDADTSKIPEADRASALEGVRDVIERRVNAFGVAEPLVQTDRSGDNWRVLVELAGVDDVNEAIAQIGETPLLEFKEQDEAPAAVELTPEQKAALVAGDSIAKERATAALSRVLKGEDFATVAKEVSEDPGSKDSGGDLGYIKRDILDIDFANAAFDTLAVGGVTQRLVKTAFGYHIIEKIDERKAEDGATEAHLRHILVRVPTEQDYLAGDASAGWKNTTLSGKQLKTALVVFDPQTSQPQVQLTFDDEGAKLFEEITGRNIGKPVGIFLDGQPISVPTVQQAIIGGQAVITGTFTVDEAKLLAQRLNAGALPVPITLLSQQTIGARLGAVAIADSLKAALVGFVLVGLFMIFYYRLPGLLAVLALLVYGSLVLALFKFWPVTLTLAGIAGFILSVGMAVDANVLIFERMKEELRRGQPLGVAVELGFPRAWTSIRDSNVSSLITCLILYWFGTSIVRGFALTLAIGIIISMFSAISVTRTFLRAVVSEKSNRRLWLYGRVVGDKI
ncbi:MAG: protein translocase subunit SecD [Patescibacteria group bacterium]